MCNNNINCGPKSNSESNFLGFMETTSCRSAGKGCLHKTQSGWTLPRTLHKRELRAPGCLFFYFLGSQNSELFQYKTTHKTRRWLNSLIILGAWTIWNHRNRCAFDGANPSMVEILILAGEERRQWRIAGARGLSHLVATLTGV
jgi:hypothetical protein